METWGWSFCFGAVMIGDRRAIPESPLQLSPLLAYHYQKCLSPAAAGPHVFYSTVDQQNVRQFGPRPCRVHKKFSILFVQSVLYCYQRAPGWADPGRKKEKYASILRAERPSTRRFRVKGDGTGRLEFVRFFGVHTCFERSLRINWLKN